MSRSYLFVPGKTPSMIQILDVFDSDAIIIDLEDSVVLNDKDAARILVSNYLQKLRPDKLEIYIRINDAESRYFLEDVTLLDKTDINGYVLPKASVEAIASLQKITNKDIIPIIESPLAVLHVEAIAKMSQIKGLLLGAEDLTKELGINRTTEGKEILYTRSKIVLACAAFGVDSIDTPYTAKDDHEGLLIDVLHAKTLGFTSKSSIHPNHIELINQAFAPSASEIFEARRIIKKAESSKKGAFSLDGKMIDLPVIERAKKVLDKAKKYNLL